MKDLRITVLQKQDLLQHEAHKDQTEEVSQKKSQTKTFYHVQL